MPNPCNWITTIQETECIGDSLDKINTNFENLQNAICDMYSLFPPGMIILYSGTVAPSGWELCRGQTISQTTYSRLYSIINNIYGTAPAGQFRLPDLRGRTAIGVNPTQLPNRSVRTLATSGGQETVALAADQNGRHTHTITDPGHTHTATSAPHNHQITDPGHVHAVSDSGHTHNIYYGIDPTTTSTGNLSAGTLPFNRAVTQAQIDYGTAQATSSTSVYQGRHSVGPYFNFPGGGAANTCPNTYWFSSVNNGGTQMMAGDQSTGYYFASVNSKTTADPLQVTIKSSDSNISLLAASTNIQIQTATAPVTVAFASSNITLGNTGGGNPHENMQPWLCLNYIIKTL